MPGNKVLVVVTSHAELGSCGHRTGVWLEEVATSCYVRQDGGAGVTLVSIKGGEIPFDPRSLPAEAGQGLGDKPPDQQATPASVLRFLADDRAQATAKNAPALASVDLQAFDAVFLPG